MESYAAIGLGSFGGELAVELVMTSTEWNARNRYTTAITLPTT